MIQLNPHEIFLINWLKPRSFSIPGVNLWLRFAISTLCIVSFFLIGFYSLYFKLEYAQLMTNSWAWRTKDRKFLRVKYLLRQFFFLIVVYSDLKCLLAIASKFQILSKLREPDLFQSLGFFACLFIMYPCQLYTSVYCISLVTDKLIFPIEFLLIACVFSYCPMCASSCQWQPG